MTKTLTNPNQLKVEQSQNDHRLAVYYKPMNRRLHPISWLYGLWFAASVLGFVTINSLLGAKSAWLVANWVLIQKIEYIWLGGVGMPLCLATLISSKTKKLA